MENPSHSHKQDIEKEIENIFGGRLPDPAQARQFFEQYNMSMLYYRCAMKEIETKFDVLSEEFSLRYDRNPISSVQTRLKRGESIYRKLRRKGLPLSVELIEQEVSDIAGIRVICPFLEDVWELEHALLSQDDIELIDRKDYIAAPKDNGYRSLHLIVAVPIFLSRGKRLVKAEVQIRTIAMDSWASLEHQLRYKKDFPLSPEQEKELKLCAELSFQMDERMEMLRRGIFGEQCALGPGHAWK